MGLRWLRLADVILPMWIAAAPARATPMCEGRLNSDAIDEQQEVTLSLLRAKEFDELQRRMDTVLDAYVAGRASGDGARRQLPLNLEGGGGPLLPRQPWQGVSLVRSSRSWGP